MKACALPSNAINTSTYVSLVRPHPEHTAPAWNSYLTKDINSFESVRGLH